MAKMLVLMMCPAGIAIALLLRAARAVPAAQGARDDMPVRLLRWAVGLLSPERAEWGHGMLGELDHIEAQDRRWRFAAGCVGAVLLLPPWGRAAAAVWAMVVVAAGADGLFASEVLRYRLGNGGWVFAAVALAFLAGFTLGASLLLRRRAVAVPGLLGGLLVALAWLAMKGFTFHGVIAPLTAPFTPLVPMVAVPLLVGVAGTLWTGSAAVGRGIARLAALSAGLGLYLYGVIAVVVLGAGGPPADPGSTVPAIIGDRLGSNMMENLVAIPLLTATIGWAAAAATARSRPDLAARIRPDLAARSRPDLAASAVSVPFAAAGPAGQPSRDLVTAPHHAGSATGARSWPRTAWLLLLCATVAATVVLAAVSGLRG